MKLANTYYMDDADYRFAASTNTSPHLYLIGVFVAALETAGLRPLVGKPKIDAFEVNQNEDGTCDVYLTSLSDSQCCEALLELRAKYPDDAHWRVEP